MVCARVNDDGAVAWHLLFDLVLAAASADRACQLLLCKLHSGVELRPLLVVEFIHELISTECVCLRSAGCLFDVHDMYE